MKTVTLISKTDCHLCEIAKEVLLRVQKSTPFEFQERKIVPGESNFEKYKEHVPVILFDGKLEFQHRVSERELRERLKEKE